MEVAAPFIKRGLPKNYLPFLEDFFRRLVPGFEHFFQHQLDPGHQYDTCGPARRQKLDPVNQPSGSIRRLPKFVEMSPKWEGSLGGLI